MSKSEKTADKSAKQMQDELKNKMGGATSATTEFMTTSVEDLEADFKSANMPELRFYKPEIEGIGKINLRGVILARRQRPADPREPGKAPGFYFVVGLTQPCPVVNHDGDVEQGKPGDYVWLDQRYAFQPLEAAIPIVTKEPNELAPSIKAVKEIVVIPLEKVKMKGRQGQSVWKFDLKTRVLSADAAGKIVEIRDLPGEAPSQNPALQAATTAPALTAGNGAPAGNGQPVIDTTGTPVN